jgi:cation transport ATPase
MPIAAQATTIKSPRRKETQPSRRTMRIIRQNLSWSFAYNVIRISVVALGLLAPTLALAAFQRHRGDE